MQRDKGRVAEAEVRAILAGYGFAVRGLEGSGDHLAIGHGLVLHSEVKRQEVLRLPLWTRQARAEAPAGTVPLVSYRQNRRAWFGLLPVADVAAILAPVASTYGDRYDVHELNGELWARGLLDVLLGALIAGAGLAKPQEALS